MNPEKQKSIAKYHKEDIEKIFEVLFNSDSSYQDFKIAAGNILIHIDEGYNDLIVEQINCSIEFLENLKKKFPEKNFENVDVLSKKLKLLARIKEGLKYFFDKSKDVEFLIACVRDNMWASSALDLLKKYMIYPENDLDHEKCIEFLDVYSLYQRRMKAVNTITSFYHVKLPETLGYHAVERVLREETREMQETILTYNLSMYARTNLNAEIEDRTSAASDATWLKVTHFQYGRGPVTPEMVQHSFKESNILRVNNINFDNIKFPETLEVDGKKIELKGLSKDNLEKNVSKCLSDKLNIDIKISITDDRFKNDLVYSLKLINYSEDFSDLYEYDVRDVLNELFFPKSNPHEYTDIKIPRVVNYKGIEIETISATDEEVELYLSYVLSKQEGIGYYVSVIESDGEAYEYTLSITNYDDLDLTQSELLDKLDKASFDTHDYRNREEDTVIFD